MQILKISLYLLYINNLKQKEIMKKELNFKQTGYGQWSVSTIHYGKEIKMHYTDAQNYDLISCKDRGYISAIKSIRSQIINLNKIYKSF